MGIRLPAANVYAPQVAKEQRWLPALKPHLHLPIPEPLAHGQPSEDFPYPWSIYRWLEGESANADNVTDQAALGSALAGFLRALQAIDPSDGPAAGAHNFFRGGALRTYDADTHAATELLGRGIDAAGALAVWKAALASRWDRAPVWIHGDMAPSNLLVVDGALRAVIDFGSCGVGDPACDLVMTWTFFDAEGRAAFRAGLDFDEATWARARGWALWKALVTLTAEHRGGAVAGEAARRFGWRLGPRAIIEALIAESRG
jgi:aminoglycoside phosphotransferase (APT) family kinase protein